MDTKALPFLKKIDFSRKRWSNEIFRKKSARNFIASISLFSASILFIILLVMLKYGYAFTYTLMLLSIPIVISYVIFLLVFIGFILIEL